MYWFLTTNFKSKTFNTENSKEHSTTAQETTVHFCNIMTHSSLFLIVFLIEKGPLMYARL